MARELQRPVPETVTPAMLQKVAWAGANLGSFPQAAAALEMLADVDLSAKQVRRVTEQTGQERLEERLQAVETFRELPLMQRLASPVDAVVAQVGAVMMDGGRDQRRDHFGEEHHEGSHWKEDKVGIVLHLSSEVHDRDPHPEFPEWLTAAEVVREIASLGSFDEEKDSVSRTSAPEEQEVGSDSDWPTLTPQLLSREVIASSQSGEEFGWHLEHTAWRNGVVDAPRTAFVADGAAVNWTIHQRHFSQMTGVLDLMHALSYAWKAANAWAGAADYRRDAEWIWQGQVRNVIDELTSRPPTANSEETPGATASPCEDPIQRALTYFTNHQSRMNYPAYRQAGLPLTSSHMESTIKQINVRMKGSEKFFERHAGETLLQLRADSLSDSRPLDRFWTRQGHRQTGANRYRTPA